METYVIFVDESTPGSLMFVMELSRIGNCKRIDAGVYQVTAEPEPLSDLIKQYPQAFTGVYQELEVGR